MIIASESQGNGTRGAIRFQGGATGDAIRSPREDTEGTIGSRGNIEGTAKSRERGTIEPRGGDKRCSKASDGPVVPARRKLTISGKCPPNNINADV